LKKVRTPLDDEFEDVLNGFADKLHDINQRAVAEEQEDIKGLSCYLIEIIDTILGNRHED